MISKNFVLKWKVSIGKFSIVRGILKQIQSKGVSITFTESHGWFKRTFTIKGTKNELNKVKRVKKQFES